MGNSLRFTATPIPGAFVVNPVFREDDRGHFSRSWCLKEFAEAGINFVPLQANTGFSYQKGTLRGLHYQTPPAPEAKLVRCTKGSLFDVVVDLRPDSPTRNRWFGITLTADHYQMLYIPEGCGHGYQTLQDDTDLYYLTSQYFTPSAARGARFDDPAFGIEWPLPVSTISEQDRSWPLVGEGVKE